MAELQEQVNEVAAEAQADSLQVSQLVATTAALRQEAADLRKSGDFAQAQEKEDQAHQTEQQTLQAAQRVQLAQHQLQVRPRAACAALNLYAAACVSREVWHHRVGL